MDHLAQAPAMNGITFYRDPMPKRFRSEEDAARWTAHIARREWGESAKIPIIEFDRGKWNPEYLNAPFEAVLVQYDGMPDGAAGMAVIFPVGWKEEDYELTNLSAGSTTPGPAHPKAAPPAPSTRDRGC